MELYPAIDVRGGRCVRLYQGDFGKETVYGMDPVAVAQSYAAAGAQWIHVVDLDAALLDGLGAEPWAYFVHSYAPAPTPDVVATCDYGGPVVAAIERGPLWATQFHPEKSGSVGFRVLANFAKACA